MTNLEAIEFLYKRMECGLIECDIEQEAYELAIAALYNVEKGEIYNENTI